MKFRLHTTLCASALAATCLATPATAIAQDADRVLGPIRLVRPLSPHTIEMLYKEADSAYRGERWTAAMQGFRILVGYEPAHGRAWFRIGNLHQQRRQYVAAAGAYRRASAAIDPSAPDVPATEAIVRNKALLNLALVNTELARDALTQVEPMSDEEESALNEVRTQVSELHEEAGRRTRVSEQTVIDRGPGSGRMWGNAEPEPVRPRATGRNFTAAPAPPAAPMPVRTRSEFAAPHPFSGSPAADQSPSAQTPHAGGMAPASVPVPRGSRAGAARFIEAGVQPWPEVPTDAAPWSRRATSGAPPNVEARLPGQWHPPAEPLPEPRSVRRSAERSWADRYDDEPEVRPQVEYVRGAPR